MTSRSPLSILFLFVLHGFSYHGTEAKGYCSFPKFLWESGPPSEGAGGVSRKWIGQTEYFGNTDTWITQQVITAQETEIVIQRRVHVTCTRHNYANNNDKIPCYRQDTTYNVICLTEEPNGSFRVQQIQNQEKYFTCLKFDKRTANLIQVHRAELNPVNKDRLCYDESLKRDDWPWRAAEKQDWTSCGLVGGFDFHIFTGHNDKHCPEVWRPSRLESECLLGDGLTFIFPNQSCSFFSHQLQEQQFRCFSSWKDSGYMFLLFGEAQLDPRYILRLPADSRRLNDRFSAFIYLSPVAPSSEHGQVSDVTAYATVPQVTYYELQMTRSEPGVCYDESELCPSHARQGRCTNTVPFEYANYCKKSCNLCDFTPSVRPECKFPSDLIGDWVLFTSTVRESVTIELGSIRFSSLGNFVCKNRHWQDDYYKLFTSFNNGCRPRYTCVSLSQNIDDTLTMRMSFSDRVDRSFDLCDANPDQESTLGNHVRTWRPKILLPMSSLTNESCGLGRYMRSEVALSGGIQCAGFIWDVNPISCAGTTQLSVSMSDCRHRQQLDFQCLALAKMSDGIDYLVTKLSNDAPIGTERILCWRVFEGEAEKSSSSSSSKAADFSSGVQSPLFTFQRIRCDTREQVLISKSTRDILLMRAFQVPPNLTTHCSSAKGGYSVESKEVHLIGNRPSQSALLSYVHRHNSHSGTPSSDGAIPDHEPGWQPRPPRPPSSNSWVPHVDGDRPKSDEAGARVPGKFKTTNYRSIDDVDTEYSDTVCVNGNYVRVTLLCGFWTLLVGPPLPCSW